MPAGYPLLFSPVQFELSRGQSNQGGHKGRQSLEPSRQTVITVQCEISGWETYGYTL